MEPTSEQELKQLLDDGKITEEEYRDLLETIRQKEITPQQAVEQPAETKLRTGYGKAALILMIIGILLILLPSVFNVISTLGLQAHPKRAMVISACPFLFLGLLCEFFAFIFGIIGWKTSQGKIAAIGVPCLGLLIVPGLVILSFVHVARPVSVGEPEQSQISNFISHKAYSLDTIEGILTQDSVRIDNNIFAEGSGSLRIESDSSETKTIRLFETGALGVNDCVLFYSAKLKSDLHSGKAYLEMWCDVPGYGECFSRGLYQPITGITEWTSVQTPFRFEAGQSPANVKLNLVIEGTGIVWIDDIKLSSSPLSELRNGNSWH